MAAVTHPPEWSTPRSTFRSREDWSLKWWIMFALILSVVFHMLLGVGFDSLGMAALQTVAARSSQLAGGSRAVRGIPRMGTPSAGKGDVRALGQPGGERGDPAQLWGSCVGDHPRALPGVRGGSQRSRGFARRRPPTPAGRPPGAAAPRRPPDNPVLGGKPREKFPFHPFPPYILRYPLGERAGGAPPLQHAFVDRPLAPPREAPPKTGTPNRH